MIQRYPDVVGNIDIDSSSWAKSLFKRIGFVKPAKTSAKVSIFDGAREEIEYLVYQSECGKMWTRITPNTDTFYAVSMILNIDQTPMKYVFV